MGVSNLVFNYFPYINIPGKAVVSVGSGTGYIEVNYLDKGIICIDPEPDKCQCGEIVKNDFALVEDYIRSKPDAVGNCTLLLNWPSQNDERLTPNYDLQAIKDLRPIRVLLVIERSEDRFSGSDSLHDWLDDNSKDYRVIKEESKVVIIDGPIGKFQENLTYILLERNDCCSYPKPEPISDELKLKIAEDDGRLLKEFEFERLKDVEYFNHSRRMETANQENSA
ncbi:unnamed protein product [Sphagnum jensenii]